MKVRRGHAHARLAATNGSRPGGCVLLITNLLNLGSAGGKAQREQGRPPVKSSDIRPDGFAQWDIIHTNFGVSRRRSCSRTLGLALALPQQSKDRAGRIAGAEDREFGGLAIDGCGDSALGELRAAPDCEPSILRKPDGHGRPASRAVPAARYGGLWILPRVNRCGRRARRAVPAAPEGELLRLRTVDGRGRPAPRAVPAAPGRELSKLPTVDDGHSCPAPRAVLAA